MSNVVIEWNNVYLEAIRQKGGAPCPIARVGAMMHGAIYDAVNSIVKTHRPYLISIPVAISASIESAVAQAAYQILVQVYPEQKATFDLRLQESLDRILAADSAQNVESGRIIGTAAATNNYNNLWQYFLLVKIINCSNNLIGRTFALDLDISNIDF